MDLFKGGKMVKCVDKKKIRKRNTKNRHVQTWKGSRDRQIWIFGKA